jgi:putative glutamine amidotransferase
MPPTSSWQPGPTRPRIGITAWRRALPTSLGAKTDLYTLAVEYVAAVRNAGGLPVILPEDDEPDRVLDLVDGLLLSGGGDVAPEAYGAADSGQSTEVRAEADAWEIALVRRARARELPVLGICRGMQIMAVALGGALDQDIAGAPGHPDMRGLDPAAILGTRHGIEIVAGTAVAHVYGTALRDVNTIHHQAVRDAGEFRVAARAAGGLVEAIDLPGGWPALAVQWHPEKADGPEEKARERSLFVYFVASAAAYASRTRGGC